jgi:hypothetical protein
VGLNYLTNAINSLTYRELEGESRSLDYYLDLVLRHFANESFLFAVLAGYIPALMLISLMVAFYLYLQQRSRAIALGALMVGIILGALWIARRMFGTVMSAMASQYSEAPPGVKQDVFAQAKQLYYYESLGRLLSGGTSLVAYALFGYLFLKGRGLEFFTGVFFLASALVLLIHQFTVSMYVPFERADVLIFPALAFLLAGVLLWKYKTEAETWQEPTEMWFKWFKS